MGPDDFSGGPGFLTWNGLTIQPRDENWECTSEIVTVDERTHLQGKIGRREEYVKSVISVQPIALLSILASQFTKLMPYRPSMRGQRIRGSSDKPLVIQTKDGRSITYTSAVLTKMPNLQFAPNKPLFGACEFTCLRKSTGADSATDSHVVEAASAYVEPAIDPSDIVSDLFTVAFGETFADIETDEDGVTFEPNVQLQELSTAKKGLLNFMIGDVDAMVKFKPQSFSSADFTDTLLQVDGATAGRGKLLGARGLAFTVTGTAVGSPILTIPLACASTGKMQFGTQPRVGEVTLQALRDLANNNDLFNLTVVLA